MEAIHKDVAWQLCSEIREGNRSKLYSFARWQCGGCTKFSKGDPDKMCFSNLEGFRGCNLVNRRYDKPDS